MNLKNVIKYIALFALLIIVSLLFLIRSDLFSPKQEIKGDIVTNYTTPIFLADQTILVEIANTEEKRTTGLSWRSELKDGQGMLFVFDNFEVQKFWMKDMNFPIDIIWFDENQKIIHIEYSASPESYPEFLGPDTKSRYVLEVPAGFSSRAGIKIGDLLKI